MKILDVVQGSPEWLQARVGLPSASNFDKIVMVKGTPSKQAEKYLYRLAGERVSGVRDEGYQNASMLRGIEMEQTAADVYETISGNKVEKVGLCFTDDESVGASPDRLIGKDGQIEIKCPEIHTHVDYLLKNEFPTTYHQQVQGQLFVTGREWCDFVSYYPGLPMLIVRVMPNKEFQISLKANLKVFCDDLKVLVEKIEKL